MHDEIGVTRVLKASDDSDPPSNRATIDVRPRGDRPGSGLATPLRYALTKYASVEAASPRALTRKVTTLAAHRGVWIDHPTTATVIEAAVMSDAVALGLDAAEEGRLRRRLRGDR